MHALADQWTWQVQDAFPAANFYSATSEHVRFIYIGDLGATVWPTESRFIVRGPRCSSPETNCTPDQLGSMLVRVISEILEANRCTP